MELRKFIATTIREHLNKSEIKTLRVFHGTTPKFVDGIKKKGLEDISGTPYQQGWYMVSTDFESALFHANPSDGNKDFVYVFEFQVPITENDRWVGYPYLWKGEKLNDNSTWFALKEKLPNDFISKIHKISYDDWIKQKERGF